MQHEMVLQIHPLDKLFPAQVTRELGQSVQLPELFAGGAALLRGDFAGNVPLWREGGGRFYFLHCVMKVAVCAGQIFCLE